MSKAKPNVVITRKLPDVVESRMRELFTCQTNPSDKAFSKLDLITCRNLLIYFETGLQQRVLQTFHYGLKKHGTLWLGPSETIANSTKLFKASDKRTRLYVRLDVAAEVPRPMPGRGPFDEQADRGACQ